MFLVSSSKSQCGLGQRATESEERCDCSSPEVLLRGGIPHIFLSEVLFDTSWLLLDAPEGCPGSGTLSSRVHVRAASSSRSGSSRSARPRRPSSASGPCWSPSKSRPVSSGWHGPRPREPFPSAQSSGHAHGRKAGPSHRLTVSPHPLLWPGQRSSGAPRRPTSRLRRTPAAPDRTAAAFHLDRTPATLTKSLVSLNRCVRGKFASLGDLAHRNLPHAT